MTNEHGYGEIVKRHRIMNKRSQRWLAKKVGVSNSTISRIESEENVPDIFTIIKIVRLLDTLSMEEMMLGFGYKERDGVK